jgi:hypothetical protein
MSGVSEIMHVESVKALLQLAYVPQTDVYRRCLQCNCCEQNKNATRCFTTVCCKEIKCNEPKNPSNSCSITPTSCGCDQNTCNLH